MKCSRTFRRRRQTYQVSPLGVSLTPQTCFSRTHACLASSHVWCLVLKSSLAHVPLIQTLGAGPALGDGPAVLSFCPTAKKFSSRQGRRHLLLIVDKATAKHDIVVLASRRTLLARRRDCSSMDRTPQALVPASVDDDADDGLGQDVELVEGPHPKRAKLSKKGAAVYKSKFNDA